MGLHFGVNLREPHQCPCGKLVDAHSTHGLSCKRGAARAIRHHQLNDIVCRALVRANIPSVLEPSGLSIGDGKRPDGMMLIPLRGGNNATWDVTIIDTVADAYLHLSSTCAGSAAEGTASRKETSTKLSTTHTPSYRSLSKSTDQSMTRALNFSKN